jgi:hypothetical protein
LNDHLDYFGHTIHEALLAIGRTPAASLVLSRPVASDPHVAARLATLGLFGSVLPDEPPGCSFGPLIRLELGASSSPQLRFDHVEDGRRAIARRADESSVQSAV